MTMTSRRSWQDCRALSTSEHAPHRNTHTRTHGRRVARAGLCRWRSQCPLPLPSAAPAHHLDAAHWSTVSAAVSLAADSLPSRTILSSRCEWSSSSSERSRSLSCSSIALCSWCCARPCVRPAPRACARACVSECARAHSSRGSSAAARKRQQGAPPRPVRVSERAALARASKRANERRAYLCGR